MVLYWEYEEFADPARKRYRQVDTSRGTVNLIGRGFIQQENPCENIYSKRMAMEVAPGRITLAYTVETDREVLSRTSDHYEASPRTRAWLSRLTKVPLARKKRT